MKRTVITVNDEQDIIANLIVSNRFCNTICPILDVTFFKVGYAANLAGWIKEYVKEYQKAPKQDIVKIVERKTSDINDEALVENINSFLNEVNINYDVHDLLKKKNVDFAIDNAVKYFQKRQIEKLAEQLQFFVEQDDIEKAQNFVLNFTKVSKSKVEKTKSFFDESDVDDFFNEDEEETVFEFAGDYGKIVGEIKRGNLYSFAAPMKRGKTFALIHSAITAMKNGRKVLFVSLEMNKHEVYERFLGGMFRYTKNIKPVKCKAFNQSKTGVWTLGDKDYKVKEYDKDAVKASLKKFKKQYKGDLIIQAVPAYSWGTDDLKNYINQIIAENDFVPDVVIVDYADIMQSKQKTEYRHQLDYIWKTLRSIAQEFNCAVFTATQTNRKGFTKVTDDTIAEDIRKLAHVSCMIAIEQNEEMKKNNLIAMRVLKRRDGESGGEVWCTQCLPLCKFITKSLKINRISIVYNQYKDKGNNRKRRQNFN